MSRCRRCGLPGTSSLDEALRTRFDQLIGWAKAGKNSEYYLMDVENVDALSAHVITAVQEELSIHGGFDAEPRENR